MKNAKTNKAMAKVAACALTATMVLTAAPAFAPAGTNSLDQAQAKTAVVSTAGHYYTSGSCGTKTISIKGNKMVVTGKVLYDKGAKQKALKNMRRTFQLTKKTRFYDDEGPRPMTISKKTAMSNATGKKLYSVIHFYVKNGSVTRVYFHG